MRVFVAGATGAVGRPLVRQLRQAGHEVSAATRDERRADALRDEGAEPVVCDVLDRDGLARAVAGASPEVVVNQLTDLPADLNPRKLKQYYRDNDRVRLEGGLNLLKAAAGAGARRIVVQSVAFYYASNGGGVKDEEDPIFVDAPEPGRGAMEAGMKLERAVTGSEQLDGVVLRYGFFYGPRTYWAPGGSFNREVMKRRYPILAGGKALWSWIHVEDAAAAAVATLDRGASGIYNIVDDEPAPVHEWLPFYAQVVGAKPPRRLPKLVGRLAAGPMPTWWATEMPGASNAKARRELGWEPRYGSWRSGFREALA